ncbi:MAG: enoyl-CoA hydratase-related protein [Acidimicrobiales bacterium]
MTSSSPIALPGSPRSSPGGLGVDFGGSWFLPRRIGLHRAKELAFFADLIDADEADRIGLVNRIVDNDQLDEFVAQWAGRLAAGPPIALAQTKRLLHESFESTLAQALDREGTAQTVNFTTAEHQGGGESVHRTTRPRVPRSLRIPDHCTARCTPMRQPVDFRRCGTLDGG